MISQNTIFNKRPVCNLYYPWRREHISIYKYFSYFIIIVVSLLFLIISVMCLNSDFKKRPKLYPPYFFSCIRSMFYWCIIEGRTDNHSNPYCALCVQPRNISVLNLSFFSVEKLNGLGGSRPARPQWPVYTDREHSITISGVQMGNRYRELINTPPPNI